LLICERAPVVEAIVRDWRGGNAKVERRTITSEVGENPVAIGLHSDLADDKGIVLLAEESRFERFRLLIAADLVVAIHHVLKGGLIFRCVEGAAPSVKRNERSVHL